MSFEGEDDSISDEIKGYINRIKINYQNIYQQLLKYFTFPNDIKIIEIIENNNNSKEKRNKINIKKEYESLSNLIP